MKIKLIIFFLFSITILQAQIRFERLILPEGGVPLHLTFCMIQDSKGFIWFGTMYGLVRYDGKDFKIFRHDPDDKGSISFDDIVSLHEDSKGNLWIGTWGGGLNLFDPVRRTFKRFPADETGSIIWQINGDASGNIWFTTEQNMLKKYVPQKGFKSYSVNDIRNIFISGGIPLFASAKGVLTYDQESDSIIEDARFIQLNNTPVQNIISDNSGNFICALNNKIIALSPKKGSSIKTLYESSGEIFSKLLIGSDNSIWAASGNGLKRINNGNVYTFTYDPQNPSTIYGNAVQDLFLDRSGMLWISSYNRGISKINFEKNNFHTFNVNYPKCFAEDDKGNVWTGSYGTGLIKIAPATRSIEIFDNKITGIQDLLIEGDNILYVNSRGLLSYEIKSKQSRSILPGIFRVIAKHGDKLFLGSEGKGLYLYDILKRTLHQLQFEFSGLTEQHNYILTLFIDSKERLWIGTYGGLIKLDLKTFKDQLYKYDQDKSGTLSNNYVYNIFEDEQNIIWVATSNGLNRLSDDSNTFTRFYEKNGLPNGVINGITSDSRNNLWLTTNKGLSRYDPSANIFTNYNNKKGLAENVFLVNSIFRDSRGYIYTGSANGISYFHPDSIALRNFQPDISLTSISSKNEELIPENNLLVLTADQNYFILRFTSFDYSNPAMNTFRYKLKGFDDDWIYPGNINSASYTNVPPGEYVFIVSGTNSDGIWSTKTAKLNLIVLPPFWQKWWFISAAAAFLILILLLAYRLKVRQKIRLALSLEKARQEENAATRKKTAVDFHDELGHRLTRVSLLTELIRRRDPGSEVLPLLNKISENVKELYTGMKDFVWAIDPKDDSLYELLVRLKDFGDDLFSDSQVSFEVNGFDEQYKDLHLPMDYRRHLILLFKEGMNNTIKYAGSDRVILESRFYEDELEMSLTDFGAGITRLNNEGRGLESMKKRAELLKGELQIKTNPGSGTQIIFRSRLLIKNLHFN